MEILSNQPIITPIYFLGPESPTTPGTPTGEGSDVLS